MALDHGRHEVAPAAVAPAARLSLEPLDIGFGARVRDVRIQDLVPAAAEALNDALCRHQLLIFEGQSLTAAEYTAFGNMFGPIERHLLEQFHLPQHPDIFVISNLKENGRAIGHTDGGFVWHTDMGFAERPAAATMLYTREAPSKGGDTIFASTYLSFEGLPDDERSYYAGLDVIHSFEELYRGRKAQPRDEERKRWPDVIHPLVRTHPVTGRNGFYLGFGDVRAVSGMEQDAGLELIKRLADLTTQPQRVYRHTWQVGDVVIWDNRGMLHAATPYDKDNDRRLVWRISVQGERPFQAMS